MSSSLDADHALDQHHNPSQPSSSSYDPAAHDIDPTSSPSSIPPLPAYAYTPSVKRPKFSTSFEQSNSSTGVNGTRRDSPDPHDFYRHHQHQFGKGSMDGLGQGDIKVERRNGNIGHQQRSGPISRAKGQNLHAAPSRINTHDYHSSRTSNRSPLSAAKSSPTLNTARNRQTSLKDLVDKFNQTPDETLPVPRKSSSRSPSTGSNPSASAQILKPRNSSMSVRTGNGSSRIGFDSESSRSTANTRPHPRRGRTNEDANPSPRSKKTPRPQRTDALDPRMSASQSMINLAPYVDNGSRRPLFGEILAMSSNLPDPGYGISAARRRRGSEGSMHSPNPMFPEERHRHVSEGSPSSPSAWYSSVIPTLEEIKTEKLIPDLPTNMHRRTRSDFIGVPSGPPTSRMYGTDLSPTRDRPSSPSSIGTLKRNSQSRIPISTRRLSTTSDSGNSTPSTRNNSALGRPHMKSPTKIMAPVKKNHPNPRSPQRPSRSKTPQRSPLRDDSGAQRPATSPRLAAYISAPMPKKSPPLRSSRPRQPVSSASTSASRARAADRFSRTEGGSLRNTRESRPRKPPELGAVDFAARRQKIQQAFTQTVKENERQEVEAEHRRMSMAQEDQQLEASHTKEEIEEPGHRHGDSEPVVDPGREDRQEMEDDNFQTPAEELPKSERELTINTGHLSERSVLDLSMEDSPTLGTYDRFSSTLCRVQEGNATSPSDVEPSSAITTDSVDTFFDDEPQEDSQDSSRNPSQDQQTLLDQIMYMRESSPSPEDLRHPDAAEESNSEKDDQESIQIMLGDTPVLEKAREENLKDVPQGKEPESRWSMSSWTSSTRSRDDRDTPMERIDEHSPSRPTQPSHLSTSTSTSEQVPQQAWSPASFSSPRTARTTLDSDAYSTINRVLDHYHDANVVSPELMNDVQQHILTQSPDLARQGGWDPKKVTQLYLQELAKRRYEHSASMPDPLKYQIRKRTTSLRVPPVPEKEVREDHDEKMVESMERGHNDSTQSGNRLVVDEGDLKPARASLTGPDDWDMSPSLGGIDLQAEAVDSPIEEKPSLPPKDWKTLTKEMAEMRHQAGQPAADSRPQLPPIQGLGLAINIMPPQRDDSPVIPPPPLPIHSPPPPPADPVTSNVYPDKPPVNDAMVRSLPSQESSRPSRSMDSSVQPSGSSSVFEDRPSVEGPAVSTESTSKASSPSPDQKRLTRRRHIIKELVDTEHSFGQDMKVVDDIYKGTSNVIIISAEDVKTLFGNSDQIVAFSTNFLDALKGASKSVYVLPKSKRWRSNRVSNATSYSGNTDDQSSTNGVELTDDDKDRKSFIGEAFGHHMTNMEKVYAEYLKNHDAANQKLQVLQKNPKVQIWLKECRAYAHDLTSAWDLDSLLVKPVQRILKYPLLLEQLLEATPENHPDYTALDIAVREIKGISMRINEMKRRADIMEQVTSNRKRKESDVRIGLSKAFGRRTEKLRQQVGLSDMVEDKAYSAVYDKFGSCFFQLQVVMRDVEMYTNDVQIFMNRFTEFVLAMEAHIDVAQTNYPEVESKWRKFRMSTREMSMTALTDHIAAIRKHVIEPMMTLLKLYEGPQKLTQKRNKRIMDYARFKAIKDRGDKPDKKTIEQGEQFIAVNDTLKDELPKLFSLTGKLVETCLNNFVQLQLQWQIIWRKKLSQAIDDSKVPSKTQDIINAFTGDFAYVEAQALSLGVCNGSMLNDAANFLSPSTTFNGDDSISQRQASSLEISKRRTLSFSSDKSPILPKPDFGGRSSGSFFAIGDGIQLAPAGQPTGNYVEPSRRMRASSTLSGHSPRTPEVPGSYHSYSNSTTPVSSTPGRLITTTGRTFTESSPALSRPSVDHSSISHLSEDSTRFGRHSSGSTYPSGGPISQHRAASPSARYSGFFSSAMPMSDSPRNQSPAPGQSQKDFNVIFLAASVYEFNIDRARKEAGYPYLTYVAGEIFDVIGEKGELWLAKNQDDSDNLVGWIWNKHFVKLAS